LLGSARALGCISNSLLRVLSLKGFLSGSLEQVTPMSLPLATFAHSLPEIHMALLFAAARSISKVEMVR
jgi:hypothetical protein